MIKQTQEEDVQILQGFSGDSSLCKALVIPVPFLTSINTTGSVLKGKAFHLCAMSPWESKAPGLFLPHSKRHFLLWFWLREAKGRTENWNPRRDKACRDTAWNSPGRAAETAWGHTPSSA